ncbi:hypothetical protein DESC_740153 [Desulfosarcina cetonica]|nr:hypothetical protein DESC_740153 [Desulfosarcina cetonica]
MGEIIARRKTALFDAQRTPPFFQEIPQDEAVAVDAVGGLVRVDHRTDGKNVLQAENGPLGALSGNAQGEITAQGESGEKNRSAVFLCGNLPHGIEHLVQKHGVENSRIQVVAGAMIAEIEPEDIIPAVEQKTARGQDIGGVRAALPAVQQNHHPPVMGPGLTADESQQPDALVRGQDHFPGGVQHGIVSPGPQAGAG